MQDTRYKICDHYRTKPHTEIIEGPETFTRFEKAMKKVIAVPISEIKRRIEELRKEPGLNPNKRA